MLLVLLILLLRRQSLRRTNKLRRVRVRDRRIDRPRRATTEPDQSGERRAQHEAKSIHGKDSMHVAVLQKRGRHQQARVLDLIRGGTRALRGSPRAPWRTKSVAAAQR